MGHTGSPLQTKTSLTTCLQESEPCCMLPILLRWLPMSGCSLALQHCRKTPVVLHPDACMCTVCKHTFHPRASSRLSKAANPPKTLLLSSRKHLHGSF